ncbi:MAG TPA: ATP-binding protein [Solirubrobacteraceae bacterium]|nr:ATP-binding protein [Solirubrobacteraceae bacterium]
MSTRSESFRRDPGSVGAARRFAADVLRRESPDALEAIVLMVSELATNSVRHAGTGFRLTIHQDPGRVRVEVTDAAGGRPRMRSPGPEEPNGRGLRIVDMLSDRWGVDGDSPAGKTVWFTLEGS